MDDDGWVRYDASDNPRDFDDLLAISKIMAKSFYTPWIGQDAMIQSEHPCFFPKSMRWLAGFFLLLLLFV
jgi:hypothetical protein